MKRDGIRKQKQSLPPPPPAGWLSGWQWSFHYSLQGYRCSQLDGKRKVDKQRQQMADVVDNIGAFLYYFCIYILFTN